MPPGPWPCLAEVGRLTPTQADIDLDSVQFFVDWHRLGWPPILVACIAGRYWVMDGHCRLVAAKLLGIPIWAMVVQEPRQSALPPNMPENNEIPCQCKIGNTHVEAMCPFKGAVFACKVNEGSPCGCGPGEECSYCCAGLRPPADYICTCGVGSTHVKSMCIQLQWARAQVAEPNWATKPLKPTKRRWLLAAPLLCLICPAHLLGWLAALGGFGAWFGSVHEARHTLAYEGAWLGLGVVGLLAFFYFERRSHRHASCNHAHQHDNHVAGDLAGHDINK